MNEIEYVNVKNMLSASEKSVDYPEFGIFGSGDSVEDVLYWQPKGELTFSDEDGFSCISEEHGQSAAAFLELAKRKNYGIVITPEYSMPWNALESVMERKEDWPSYCKLWCLGMEGIKSTVLDSFYEKYSARDGINIFMEDQNQLDRKDFCSCIAYLFTTRKNELVCMIQLKTTAASDMWNELEARHLTKGSKIYMFDDGNGLGRILVAYICADALNRELWENIPRYTECLVIHPQLNPKPRHDSFRQMRKIFLDYSNARIISVNWAKGTFLPASGRRSEIGVNDSFSAFYYNDRISDKKLEELLVRNKATGINSWKDGYITVWYMPDGEHCMVFSIKRMSSSTAYRTTDVHMEPTGCDYLEYDKETKAWIRRSGCLCCSVDWDWLQEVFQLSPCEDGDCDIVRLARFFSSFFAENSCYSAEIRNGTSEIVFEISAGYEENMRKKRERSKYVTDELKNKNYPKRFAFLMDGNYRWVLGKDYNLEVENSDWDGITIAYIDSSDEVLIEKGLDRLEAMIGKARMTGVLLYHLTSRGVRYYEKELCNTEINNPDLIISRNGFGLGEA